MFTQKSLLVQRHGDTLTLVLLRGMRRDVSSAQGGTSISLLSKEPSLCFGAWMEDTLLGKKERESMQLGKVVELCNKVHILKYCNKSEVPLL